MAKKLIIICGPTAVGKTALSIQLAQHFNCPIISFDSRQFYTEMNIGTAKPTPNELAQAEHHFIGNLSIHDRYTAGMYEREALDLLDTLFKKHDYCVAVGGSGLYIDALTFGIDDIPANEAVRNKLNERWKKEGLAALQNQVMKVDPDFYNKADMKNPRRVMRALEVYEITGKTYSSFRKKIPKNRPFEMLWFGLNLERANLFDRINTRVENMMNEGLEEEVTALLPYKNVKALKTVGYSELFGYLDGEYEKERAVELIQRNTRHYAKRQITWFQKNEYVKWYKPNDAEKIIEEIEK